MLIPRPETEHLVEAALDLPQGARVCDVGTGSGAVALALKQERPDLRIVATDASRGGARRRARERGAARASRSGSLEGDLLAGITDVDAVLSNPPYVEDGARLAPDVAGHEPALALRAGPDGLDVLRRLAPAIGVTSATLAAIEVGAGQAAAVEALLREVGFAEHASASATWRGSSGSWSAGGERGGPGRRGRGAVTAFERCLAAGGVAVFPADTVYGLACDPGSAAAVDRLYALKGRPPAKPAAVMCFGAAPALPELGPRTRAAIDRLTPGGVTLLLPNPEHRWPLACGPDPDTLGLRVIGGPLAAHAAARPPELGQPRRRRRRAPPRRGARADPRRRRPGARRRRAARARRRP